MAEVDRLEEIEHAPIQEAVLDVRAELPKELALEDVEALHGKVSRDYPDKKIQRIWQQEFRVGEALSPEAGTAGKVHGGIFRSEDGKQVVQFRSDGYTFSRLRPYTQWEELFPEAKRLWDVYAAWAKPLKVRRIATRYINVIELPGPKVNLDDYFTAPVPVPKDLPQELATYMQRAVLHFPAEGIQAIVTQSPAPPGSTQKPNTIPVLLDIDVFKVGEFSEAEAWRAFRDLRRIKNRVFRSYLTDEAIKLFQ